MSSRDLASLAIELSPYPARVVLIAATVLGVVAAALLPIPILFVAMTIIVVLAGGGLQAWRLGLVGQRYALRQLQCDSDGNWWVISLGTRIAIRLSSASRVGSNLVWLVARSDQGRFWLLLISNSTPEPIWRGLQVRLRLLSTQATQSLENTVL